MSLFSRGSWLIPRLTRNSDCLPIRIRAIPQRSALQHPQFHSLQQHSFIAQQSSCRSFASKAARKAKSSKKTSNDAISNPPPKVRANSPLTAAPLQTYVSPKDSYAQILASKSSPTLLYSNVGNPELTAVLAALVGGYCIVYGGFWLYDATVVQHPGLWRPINFMNGGVGIFMVALGISTLRRTRGQIGSIIAVPTRQPSGAPGLALKVESRNSMSFPLFWRRPVEWKPLMRQKIVYCIPSEVKLMERIGDVLASKGPLTGADVQKRKDQLLAQDPSGLKFFMDPLRRIFGALKKWMLKILVGEGFVNVQVQNKKYRMDVNSGWLLDDGQPMERLLNAR